MEYFAIPLGILAFAFLVNGFPNINITHKHYHNGKKESRKED